MREMLRVIQDAVNYTDCPVVLFSSGKDSIVTLDIVSKYFKDFKIIHMYFVKGLSYREKVLNYYSKKYDKEIIQIPHFTTINTISRGVFSIQKPQKKESFLNLADIERQIRNLSGQKYLCTGEKKADSLNRRIMINHEGNGIDQKHFKIYPLADWTEKDVMKYIQLKKLPLPVEYQYGMRNLDALNYVSLHWIKNNFPGDYEKIKEVFPLIDTLLLEGEGAA